MRVTTQQMYDTLLSGINQQLQTQATATAQISSGQRFTRPSQDGAAYKKSIDIRHMQSGIASSLTAISTAKLRLGASENTLSQISPILQRAQALSVQQANGTLSPSERQAAATEVATLQNQLLALTNQTFEGESLFAGTATTKPAYSTAFSAGSAQYTKGANTSITNVVQTANTSAVNDTYTISLNAAGTAINSVKDSLGTEQLTGGPVTLAAGANTLTLGNGVTLSADYSGTPQANTAGGTLTVSGASAAGTLHYSGDTQDRTVAITSTQTVVTNVRADSTAFTQAFAAIKTLKDALSANDVAGIKSSITQLTTAGKSMSELTAEVGGRLSTVGIQEQSYNNLKTQTDQLLSKNEATDIPATVTKLNQAQTALQAAYAEASKISNISLVNYLK